jgi:hypothetical protein
MSLVTATIEISKAVHAQLSSDIAVQAVLGTPPRLYDHPPEDPIFPYLTYGPMRSEDIGGDEAPLSAHLMTLHLWSRYSGRAQVMSLLEAVILSLESGKLSLSGMNLVKAQVKYTDIFRAPDGLTLHGLIRFSLITDPEEAS